MLNVIGGYAILEGAMGSILKVNICESKEGKLHRSVSIHREEPRGKTTLLGRVEVSSDGDSRYYIERFSDISSEYQGIESALLGALVETKRSIMATSLPDKVFSLFTITDDGVIEILPFYQRYTRGLDKRYRDLENVCKAELGAPG